MVKTLQGATVDKPTYPKPKQKQPKQMGHIPRTKRKCAQDLNIQQTNQIGLKISLENPHAIWGLQLVIEEAILWI